MKLARVTDDKAGVIPAMVDDSGALRDLSAHVPDIAGAALLPETLAMLARLDPERLPRLPGDAPLAPCVGAVGKFLCIGLNYHDHAAEAGMAPPEHPILFLKATSAIAGAQDDVVLPRRSVATDWEVELGVVIGRAAKYVSFDQALDHVAGYCVVNDLSERDYQFHLTGQWTKGKSCDGFGPIGPWLVTPDEVGDPQALSLTLDVNGVRMQDGRSADMIFSVAEIIAHLSTLFTLHPGDVIATGTPKGVGMGMKPAPVYLRPGDEMVTAIPGLGAQRQRVVADPTG